jgi:hypothetical protein
MSRRGTSETRALRDLAERLGFLISVTKRGHFKFILPGAGVVIASRNSSDRRAIHHARAQLARVARRAQRAEAVAP